MIIPRLPVTSSQIKSIGHDDATNTLAIEFINGGVYHYGNFTRAEFVEFATAKSIASFFYARIKGNEKYPYAKQP